MADCSVAYNLAGVNALCVSDPEPMRRANVDGAVAAVHAAILRHYHQVNLPPEAPEEEDDFIEG